MLQMVSLKHTNDKMPPIVWIIYAIHTFIDRHNMRHTITSVKDYASCSPSTVQGQDSLDVDIESRTIECLKHNLKKMLKDVVLISVLLML